MTPDDLKQLFPNLTPVKTPPSLTTINGCGTMLYGRRDMDPNSGTYVMTLCVTVVFIPLAAIRAYRVADAENGGWYFLGREPLSSWAKAWNTMLLLVTFVGLGSWGVEAYLESPGVVAGRNLKKARELEEEGRIVDAVELYKAADRHRPEEARAGLARIALERIAGLPLAQAAPIVRALLIDLPPPWAFAGPAWIDGLMRRAEEAGPGDPGGGLALVDVLRMAVKDKAALASLEERLLEAAVAREAGNVDWVERLAALLESRGEADRCEALLAPLEDRLGARTGARILGQILVRKGEMERAFKLLLPYVEKRMEAYRKAEKGYSSALDGAYRRAIGTLNQGKGPQSFYTAYDAANEAEKERLVGEFAGPRAQADPAVAAARAALSGAAEVVPVAIDLGIVRLSRAQARSEAGARKSELEAAEQVFLAVSTAADESDEYRLFLGQVKYWLGKHDEGKKLLEAFLESKTRAPAPLMQVAGVLRLLGAHSDARALAEEAYQKAADGPVKFQAASLRGLLGIDDDDAIAWYEKSDRDSADVRACLATHRGRKAAREGEDEAAARHFQEAVRCYGELSETSSVLNNRAIVLDALYSVTGDAATLEEAGRGMDQALRLNPESAILMGNVGSSLIERALARLAGESFDLKVLRPSISMDFLGLLYDDAAGREALIQRLRADPEVVRAVELMEKARILGPKSPFSYYSLLSMHRFTRDREALEGMIAKAKEVELDLADAVESARKTFRGERLEEEIREQEADFKRRRRLLEAARATGDARTVGAAALLAAEEQLGLFSLGAPCDVDGAVTLAEEGFRAHRCVSARAVLVGALLLRGCRRVSERSEPLAELLKRGRRLLSLNELGALALEASSGEDRAALLADADFRRALELVRESQVLFPEGLAAWDWAILHWADPEGSAARARQLEQNKVYGLVQDLQSRLVPMSLAMAYTRHWVRLAAGDAAGAKAELDAAAEKGIPVPWK